LIATQLISRAFSKFNFQGIFMRLIPLIATLLTLVPLQTRTALTKSKKKDNLNLKKIKMRCKLILAFLMIFSMLAPLNAQTQPPADIDALKLIGLTIREIIETFGPPNAVYAVRGAEEWQDDVVFEYPGMDFYLSNNKIWQISINKALGINVGNPKAAVLLVLGDTAQDKGAYILQSITGRNWPMEWRFNINAGKVSSIYLYRMDF
jgi:hypothetical protein